MIHDVTGEQHKEAQMGLARLLFRSARTAADIEALASGSPKRIGRRAKNKLVGRALGRAYRRRFNTDPLMPVES